MDRFTRWLFSRLQSRDSRIIEIYFEMLNVCWLAMLWVPGASLAFDITNPLYLYLFGAWTGSILFVAFFSLFMTSQISLRIAVLMSYVVFYFLTGMSLLLRTPINIFGLFFLCQGLLAIFLVWKLRTKC